MDQPGSIQAYKSLSEGQQRQYRLIMHELMSFTQSHAIPMCFGPPLVTAPVPLPDGSIATVKLPLTLGKVDGASGCVLQLQSGHYFVTAEHVLADYEKRIEDGEMLNWQIGKPPPFDPAARVKWRDKTEAYKRSQMPYRSTDIVFLRLSQEEAHAACGEARIIPLTGYWPPPQLKVGQVVVLAGYPNQIRTIDLSGTMDRQACGLTFQVTSVGDGYCKCQFAYGDLIDFGGNAGQPDLSSVNLGGMSGCPVFVLASAEEGALVQVPRLAGVFSQRWRPDFLVDLDVDFLEIATFAKVRENELRV